MNTIYLDNSATTQPYKEVADLVSEVMYNNFANPSSLHTLGMNAEKLVRDARSRVAKLLGADEAEIFFTSGGTESDNTAILGFARANKKRGMHIITTSVEHPAVSEAICRLECEGFSVTRLKTDKNCNIDLAELENALKSDTILVCIMHVNNEVGSIFPIEKLKSVMKSKSPKAALFTDAVQSFGKLEIKPGKIGVDMLSASGHKIHGPKGVGILYIRKSLIINPILYGGHQQSNLRSGTENTSGIAGFALASEMIYNGLAQKQASIEKCKTRLKQRILSEIENTVLNSPEGSLCNILNISFPGVRSEILLHSLERHGIFVSGGSACSSNKPQPSQTLTAMGKSAKEIDSAIRFSFSEFNTTDEMDFVCECLKKEVAEIRKYVR